ncbi:uncharacterized protein LOC116144907 [Pistacia vera]|uniref:uncharacterized protein LOC116144907 n=1 Tax=Pistacia vera TaxID=55513 RepID=UPI0012632435|nr:uncharacterized protein LOC116144907 [Pistacia vera]
MFIYAIGCDATGEKRRFADIIFGESSWVTIGSDHLVLSHFDELFFQDFVELSFESNDPAFEVKRCGIHPVYEKETKELKPRTNKSSSSTFGNSYELNEDLVGSTVDVDCDGSEDEPISKIITSSNFINGESSSRYEVNEKEIEDYSDDDDEPPSKRLKEYID